MNDEVKQVFDALAALGWHIAGFEETTIGSARFAPQPRERALQADPGDQPGARLFLTQEPTVAALKLTLTRK
jgi:hypothetical protein